MGSSPEQSIIRVRDLVVGFGDQTVLDGVSFDVRRGEILGIVGASGGGKSVLLRTIIGLIRRGEEASRFSTRISTASRRRTWRRWSGVGGFSSSRGRCFRR
jgi:phospholipid/cholesterol/gamma-HCH transport system ATP-binding protein